jgi:5-methyltetrahydropteroyltriglutamate--homocysteine methyltransferase
LEAHVKLSIDRILTTHVGSLPRSQNVVDQLVAKQKGELADQQAFDDVMRDGVSDVVARQVEAGVDIVSDGETSKIAYSTYITDRLTGFEGDSPRKPNKDVAPYPEFRQKMALVTGDQPMPRAVCVGPIAIKDREQLRKDLENMAAARDASGPADVFLPAASPGVISCFQPNEYYPTHEDYIGALADAMREEYEAIVGAGFVLQVDCPDLAMAFHTTSQDLSEREFLRRVDLQIEALNHALENVPAESVRMHICWGNYEGPHNFDIPVEKIMPAILRAKPTGIQFEASNPRHAHEWVAWRDAKVPDDKVLIPGVLDSTSNFVEHPELVAQRIEQFAAIVGRERVLAGSDCGFGTFAGYSKMDPEIVYVKLRAQAEGAAIASKRLWAR